MTIAILKTSMATAARAPGSADVAALVATKLRCIAPMIAVYLTAYLGRKVRAQLDFGPQPKNGNTKRSLRDDHSNAGF
jgi:hypothetical protein